MFSPLCHARHRKPSEDEKNPRSAETGRPVRHPFLRSATTPIPWSSVQCPISSVSMSGASLISCVCEGMSMR